MELWIRSQDRENLIHTNKVGYLANYLGEEIINYVITANDIWVGGYATEERALQILDSIEHWIIEAQINERTCIYEMPEE
ncbi:MAG: hypothetical protein IIT65_04510 [Lachnospiraceae bacterium]|nr:hypothetical protein [Lachnospiraceae bacterium]